MPTKKKRVNVVPDNLPANTKPEQICPSRYTGNKLFEKDPAKYSRIVQALGEKKPMTRIAKDERVSPDTVAAILSREKKSVTAVNELTSGLVAYAAQGCLMRLIEKVEADEIPVSILGIVTGIMVDKHRSFSGEATSVIEHRKVVTIEDVRAELSEIKGEAIDAEVEEVSKAKDSGNLQQGETASKEEQSPPSTGQAQA